MPTSPLRALASTPAYNRRKSPRIAFHAFLKHVLSRRGGSGARHDFLLQKDDIGIRLADGHDEVDEVGMLVTRMYRQRGYLVPVSEVSSADSIRRVTLEACYKNQVVGTLTVNLDSGESLHAETLYRDEIGRFRFPGYMGPDPDNIMRLGTDIRYAMSHPGEDGGRRIVIMTPRIIGFRETVNQPRRYDYPFTMFEMRFNKDGEGQGKMAYMTQIYFDKKENAIALENYGTEPVRLNNLKLKVRK